MMHPPLRLAIASATAALAIAIAPPALAAQAPITYVIGPGSGEIGYDMTHPMHKVHGVSRSMTGKVAIAGGHLVTPTTFVLPLLTFDSGNASRDSNAALTLDAGRFPQATLAITAFKEASNAIEGGTRHIAGVATGQLGLRGVLRSLTIPVQATVTPGQVIVDAQFPLLLTDYQIPRPSLLFRPVDDEVKVTVHAVAQPR